MTPPLDDPPRPEADGSETTLDFGRVASRPPRPPPPRPDVLDSLAPVDFRAEADLERRRRDGLRRRGAALRVAGVAFGAAVATAGVLVFLVLDGPQAARGRGAERAVIAPAPAEEAAPAARPAARPPTDVAPRAEAPSAAVAPADAPTPADAQAVGSGAAAPRAEAPPRERPRAAVAPGSRPAVRAPRERLVSDDPSRPVTPSRAQVRTAMESVRARIEACAAGLPGVARVVVTVSPDGRVRHAYVQGGFAGRPEGSCMARVVRDARFPAFRKADLRVAYPYALGGD